MSNVSFTRRTGRRIAAAGAIVSAAFQLAWPACAQAQSAIDWQRGEFAGQPNPRVALVVSAQVDGRACPMQVDTGLSSAVRWRGAPVTAQASGKKPIEKMVDVTVEFSGVRTIVPTPPDQAHALAQCMHGAVAGSIGNAFFEAGTLAVDLKTSRLRYTPGGLLAARLDAQPMFYAKWAPPGGYPLVEIRKGGALHGYAMLDTGNAALGFAPAAKAQWDAATSSAPLRAAERVRGFELSSGGHVLACFAMPAAVPLQAGTWALASPLVSWCPTLDFTPPLRLEGSLGLQAFGDAVVTIDYVSGRWLVEKPH
jgi:hypothetical protein